MAKIIDLYRSVDGFGRDIEIAKSVNGNWFYRNAVGGKWSDWNLIDAPSRPSVYRSPKVEGWVKYSDDEKLKMVLYGADILNRVDDLSDVNNVLPN